MNGSTLFTNLGSTTSSDPLAIAINVLLALCSGLAVAHLYRWTHKGLSYSQSFTMTLVLLSVLAACAMIIIGNDLARAFGLAGALTIIRFRTVIKDPKDTTFVFWSLIMGMACGTQTYLVAIVGGPLVYLSVLLLHRINFGSIRKYDYLLRFSRDTSLAGDDTVQQVFFNHLRDNIMQTMTAREEGRVFDVSYNVRFVEDSKQQELLKELSALDGISNVHLLSSASDIEY